MEILLDSFRQEYLAFLKILPRIVLSIIVLVISALLGKIASRSIGKIYGALPFGALKTTYANKIISWTFILLGIIIAMNILGLEKIILSVAAGGGLLAIVLGFAFKEIGENLLAGLALNFNRPFKIGDLIESEGTTGVVKDIEIRYTHIRTDDGKDIYIPNSQIFTKSLVNYTRDGLRRFHFTVGIDYMNDSRRACEVLRERAGSVEGVLTEPAPGVFISSMMPQYVELMVVFWVDMFIKSTPGRNIRSDVIESCRLALLEHKFTVSSECVSNISVDFRSPLETTEKNQ